MSAAEPLGSSDVSLPKAVRDMLVRGRVSWLRNEDVVDLLHNWKQYKFRVSKEPPVKPSGGAIFLFNRKTVRFFRKDGHNWRKKSDGKTVRETHEKLKVGNKDALNCYYAHAEEKDSLQRRCYWLLEGDDHVVLVHYLVAKPDGARALRMGSQGALDAVASTGACEPGSLQGAQGGLGASSAAERAASLGMRAAVLDRPASGSAMPGSFGGLPTRFTVTTGETFVLPPPPGAALPPPHAEGLQPPPEERGPPKVAASAFQSAASLPSFTKRTRTEPAALAATSSGGSAGGHVDVMRTASVPALPVVAREASDHILFEERRISLGPLHSAPSFSGGTVQTGSTLDPSELARPPAAPGLGLQRHSSETLHAAPHLLALQPPADQAAHAGVITVRLELSRAPSQPQPAEATLQPPASTAAPGEGASATLSAAQARMAAQDAGGGGATESGDAWHAPPATGKVAAAAACEGGSRRLQPMRRHPAGSAAGPA
ncbi:hypothetical protein WJX81_002837 [Elliptochloris bilobata]|uniref:CG-1 domain-containing protein n=1 Tax=Elliptochloris bilobata TaxID=381761 RepID=A0AAW1QWF5_9CHLO